MGNTIKFKTYICIMNKRNSYSPYQYPSVYPQEAGLHMRYR